jgi:hypothetical protein
MNTISFFAAGVSLWVVSQCTTLYTNLILFQLINFTGALNNVATYFMLCKKNKLLDLPTPDIVYNKNAATLRKLKKSGGVITPTTREKN